MSLEDLTLRSRDSVYERRAWFSPGPPVPHHLGILLDGEHYLERVDALPIIAQLTHDGRLPPMSWLFVESGGPAARHADYTYTPGFSRFIAEDALAHVRQHACIADGGHLIGGLSLSGLAAAHIAIVCGDRFSAALCQSGSFWFEPDTLAALVSDRSAAGTRFWLSVGDEETEVGVRHPPSGLFQGISQIEGVDRACAALEPCARAVHRHTYAGGHTFEPWRRELGDALCWLVAETS